MGEKQKTKRNEKNGKLKFSFKIVLKHNRYSISENRLQLSVIEKIRREKVHFKPKCTFYFGQFQL